MVTTLETLQARRERTLPSLARAPLSGRFWRELAYVVSGIPLAAVFWALSVALLAASLGLLITFLGIPLLALTLHYAGGVGALERGRARVLLRYDVGSPQSGADSGRGLMGWLSASLRNGESWRALAYSLVHLPWALVAGVVSLMFSTYSLLALTYPLYAWTFPHYLDEPGLQLWGDGTVEGSHYVDSVPEIALTSLVGLLLTLVTPWVVMGLTQVDRLLLTWLLSPSPLASRVRELERDKLTVTDTASADLRRIERDLHDGAQARLVNLAMGLGLAKEKLLQDPEAAARMVDEAHGEVKVVLQELRDLARGIHPAILTDRGLGPALSHLATRCTVPVQVQVDLATRPAQAIEGISYFTVSELLQNISKHSRARQAEVDIWRSGDRLILQVTDDGRGGARPENGSGLAGLAERLDSVDGLLALHSPEGGPTTVTVELPWRD
ncbi:sensor domain-containing protein [Streptomyces sp. NPDC005438]|uniref:sensor histidine kinase n=1 Tax=Streptomyces sp. NPDC005438 TaxID=3156880 RepID=UPI0033A21B6E